MVQAHAASLQEYADHLTGLGDSPLETLMVTVLLISLQESYTPLIISLNTHPDRMKFDFVVQHCINEKARQLSITSQKQSSGQNSAFSAESKPRKDKKNVTCYKCGKKGHYKNKCKEEQEGTEMTETPTQEKGKATVTAIAASSIPEDQEW